MKNLIIFTSIVLCLSNIRAQQKWEEYLAKNDYFVHSCNSGMCSIIGHKYSKNQRNLKKTSSWNEAINVYVFVEEGLSPDLSLIQNALTEDSGIHTNDGIYSGSDIAFNFVGWETFSTQPIVDIGFPIQTDVINFAFSDLNSAAPINDMYDNLVLDARNCYNAHKFIVLINNSTSGLQEVSSVNSTISDEENPSETYKIDAFSQFNFRNHAITHNAGGNDATHQNGPVITRRPIQIGNDKSYGWSTTGLAGFSGGNNLGVGVNGEDLAGHISTNHASWLDIMPHLHATVVAAPSELELGETGSFSAGINKDIGNENWSWAFTNGGDTFSESGSDISVSFATAGTWTYEVVVSNDCGGQTDTLSGSVTVNTAMQQAPSASCQSLTRALNNNGMASVSAADIDNGSSDPDGSIVSMTINGQNELNFGCSDLGTQDITFTVTDNDGLSATCQTTINVIDDMAPLITANDISLVLDNNGVASLDFSDVAVVSDNCTVDNSALSQSTFDCNDIGNQQISLTASDASGNTSTETITVSVADETSPTLICAEDITLSLQADETVLLTAEEFYTSLTDACGEPTVTVSQLEFSGDTPGAFDVELIATDPSGNSENCLVNVTVDIVSSTINIDQDQRIDVYPNPTSDMLYLEIDGALSVKEVILTDVTGRKFEAPFAQQISVAHLAPGIFILEVITENEVFVKKILKL